MLLLAALQGSCSSSSTSGSVCTGSNCDASIPDGAARGGAGPSTGGAAGHGGSGTNGTGGSAGTVSNPDAAAPDASPDAAATPDATTTDAATPLGWQLWVAVRNHLYAYRQSALVTSNGDDPRVDVVTNGEIGALRFDSAGNLWGIGTPGIFRLSPSQVTKSGTAGTPALSIIVSGVNTFDFDPAGKLWLGRVAGGDNWLGRFDLDVHAASGALTVTTTASTAADALPLKLRIGSYPLGMIFDEKGNLYAHLDYQSAAGQGYLNRYDATQLVGTGSFSDPPALSIAPQLYGVGVATILRDSKGRILIPGQSVITRYSTTQVAAMGQGVTTVPETTFKLAAGNPSPACLGLDPDGNLWVAGGTDSIVKIDASDVAKTSPAGGAPITVTPSVKLRAPVSNPAADFCSLAFH